MLPSLTPGARDILERAHAILIRPAGHTPLATMEATAREVCVQHTLAEAGRRAAEAMVLDAFLVALRARIRAAAPTPA